MFYYFDETTHRCVFTCSVGITYPHSICVDAADGYGEYPISCLKLVDGLVKLDEELLAELTLKDARISLTDQADALLRELEGFEKFDGVDVTLAREAVLKARHEAVKATVVSELPIMPKIKSGLLEEETE